MRVRWGCVAVLVALGTVGGCGDDGGGGSAAGRTPTLVVGGSRMPTPLVAAGLRLQLSNGGSSAQQAMLSGTRLSGPADPRPTAYGAIAQAVKANGAATVEVPALAPGLWVHRIEVPTTGQQQFRQSLIVDDAHGSAALSWTLFAAVLKVNQPADTGDGTCGATCTLRDAVATANGANTASQPTLIVFDHTALGNPAQVHSTDRRIVINAPGLTIDGTDSDGNPSPVVDFAQRTYPVRITLRGTRRAVLERPSGRDCPCTENYGGTLFASARGVSFIGLRVERTFPDLANICCGDQTLIEMGQGSADTRVDTCQLDGGGRTVPDAVTPKGNTGRATSKDCIKPEHTGSTPAHPIAVTNSELSYCLDRGVKVQDNYLLLTDNWIHNNLRCALFAIVPNGQIDAAGNLIEQNGMNCPSGAPPHCSGQKVTRPDAPQVSAQGVGTSFAFDGNVVRDGPFSGVFWQPGSTGTLANSFVCGMELTGVLSERQTGALVDARMRGSASVLNGRSGVELRGSVGVDLGSDGDPGQNAFAGNPSEAQIIDSLSTPATLVARGNEWESCYPTSGADSESCDLASIARDVTNDSGAAEPLDAADPEPHRSHGPVTLTGARPSIVTEGSVMALVGSGFDAVSGLEGLTRTDCARLGTTNTCAPLRGTCVEFLVAGEWTPAADVLGVTPTAVTVRAPFTCSAPTQVRVRRAALDGETITSNELTICRN